MGDNCSLCLLQHKYNHNYQTETEIFFLPGADVPDIYVRASTLCYQRNLSQTLEVGEGGGGYGQRQQRETERCLL